MSWLHAEIPIYQLLIGITIYVFYKELLKFIFKQTFKIIVRRRTRNDQPREILEQPENIHT